MPRFAIKKLPLNLPSMGNSIENPMSIRPELGEFEVEADSIEDARAITQTRVNPNVPHMICPWRERTKCFTWGTGRNRNFVHPVVLYKYDGKSFNEFEGNCHGDKPKSGRFMSKSDAKADYLKHKALADEKLDKALDHLEAMNELGVTIDYHMDGDTHGIYEDYMYLEVTEGAYNFTVKYNS